MTGTELAGTSVATETCGHERPLKFKITVKKTYYLKDYLPKADPKEKEFLQKYAAAEVRIVDLHMEIDFMGQNLTMTLPLFVRVSGARGRIFGFGMPQDVGALKK